jgi:CBS domain-containing protein
MSESTPKKRSADEKTSPDGSAKKGKQADRAGLSDAERKAITQFLTDVKVSQLFVKKPLISVQASDSIQQVLDVLNKNNISSAPVYVCV